MNTTTNQRSRAPKFLEVAGFDGLRHYKDREMIWVKFQISIITDYRYRELPDAAKSHLVGLMLLAAREGNRLPNDPVILSHKIGANTEIQLAHLLQSGFIIPAKRKKTSSRVASKTLAPRKHAASASTDKQQQDRELLDKQHYTDDTARGAPPAAVGSSSGGVVQGVFGSNNSDPTTQNNGSIHLPETIRAYLEDCQRQGQNNIRSIDAVVAVLHRTGRSDEVIQSWLDRRVVASLDTSQCPDCNGSSVFYPAGFDKGVAKCDHNKLLNSSAVEQRVAG